MSPNNVAIPVYIHNKVKDLLSTKPKDLYDELIVKKLDGSKAHLIYTYKYNIYDDYWKYIYNLPFLLKLNN